MSKNIRLGIIGMGAEGSAYANFISQGMVPNMVIGAISDVNPAFEEKAKELGVPFFSDYKELVPQAVSMQL